MGVVVLVVLVLSLVVCGGGESDQSGNFNVVKVQCMVVFGDSLSDVGIYMLVVVVVGGGKFIINFGLIWVEIVVG